MKELQINLPKGYETRLLPDGSVLVYGPEGVEDPETKELLERRPVLSFLPKYPGIDEEVEHLVLLDYFIQRGDLYEPEVVANFRREFEETIEFWSAPENEHLHQQIRELREG